MLVGATPLSDDDARTRDHLAARGYSITVVDDNAFATAARAGYRAVLISATAAAAAVSGALPAVNVPVVAWKPAVYGSLGLTASGSANHGTISGTRVQVDDAAARPSAPACPVR